MSNIGKEDDFRSFRKTYGRRLGKRLSPLKKQLVNEFLPKISVSISTTLEGKKAPNIDLADLFGGECPVWLEVGFGSGEHLFHQASLHPGVGILGCEIYVNGIASLLGKIRSHPQPNIRIHSGDVRDLFDELPTASISQAFLLYPDPWPKKRHHRRRFVTSEFLVPLARVMKPGAILLLATDIPDYARQAVEEMAKMREFEWLASSRRDWIQPWDDWSSTRYEKKALREGRTPIYLSFKRWDI